MYVEEKIVDFVKLRHVYVQFDMCLFFIFLIISIVWEFVVSCLNTSLPHNQCRHIFQVTRRHLSLYFCCPLFLSFRFMIYQRQKGCQNLFTFSTMLKRKEFKKNHSFWKISNIHESKKCKTVNIPATSTNCQYFIPAELF